MSIWFKFLPTLINLPFMWPMFDIWYGLAMIMIVKYLYGTQSSTSVIGSSSESGQVGSKPNTSRLVIFAACADHVQINKGMRVNWRPIKRNNKLLESFFSVDLHLRRHRDLAVQAFNLEIFKHRGNILGPSQDLVVLRYWRHVAKSPKTPGLDFLRVFQARLPSLTDP